MTGKSLAAAALAVASLVAYASPATAGPIAVHTEIGQTAGSDNGEIHVAGLGSWAVLSWASGAGPNVTVPADQTSARQAVVGFYPVMGFRDRAQYEAERDKIVTIPETPVSLYVEVYNGELSSSTQIQKLYFDTVVSGRISPAVGQNEVDWRMIDSTKQVHFGDTLVSISYTPVRMPDDVPQIYFDDGSPPIGWPGPAYYPTVLEATIDLTRGSGDGGSDASGDSTNTAAEGPPGVPEPASALLLGGFALGGLFARLGLNGRLFGAQKAALHG
jgi:hypothetical protein